MDTNDRLPAPAKIEDVMTLLQQASGWNVGREWVVCVKVHNPGAIGSTLAVLVTGATLGFDWDAGRVLLSTEKPLTTLTPDEVAAMTKSARLGQSWHAYTRQKSLAEEAAGLRQRVSAMQSQLSLTDRALQIADKSMLELLRSHCLQESETTLLMPATLPDVDQASIDEALSWLQPRGLARVINDGKAILLGGTQ